MKPDYHELYLMADPLATQPVRLEPTDEAKLDRNAAVGLLRGEIIPQQPIRLRRAMGARFTDLLWSSFTPILVISQRLTDIFYHDGLTGWEIYAVEVIDKDGHLQPHYNGFAITGRAGRHDLERVEVMERPPITPRGISYTVLKGIYFEVDMWTANDFCLMEKNISCIVTEKVVRAFRRARIRNVRFTELTQVEISASVYEVRGMWPPK